MARVSTLDRPWIHKSVSLSPLPMHPQLRQFTLQLFLDFRANYFPQMAPHFFGHHDSPSNLAKSRVPSRGPGSLGETKCTLIAEALGL